MTATIEGHPAEVGLVALEAIDGAQRDVGASAVAEVVEVAGLAEGGLQALPQGRLLAAVEGQDGDLPRAAVGARVLARLSGGTA